MGGGTMKRPRTTYVQSKKAALFAAAVNILEILAALGLTVIVLMSKSGAMARTAVVFLSLIVIIGAVVLVVISAGLRQVVRYANAARAAAAAPVPAAFTGTKRTMG